MAIGLRAMRPPPLPRSPNCCWRMAPILPSPRKTAARRSMPWISGNPISGRCSSRWPLPRNGSIITRKMA